MVNRESERKRLVELKRQFVENFDCGDCQPENEKCRKCLSEKEADYLLDNGIVVPPFKIGETLHDISEYVYGISSPEIYEMENDRMTIEKLEDGDFIFIYEDAEIRHEYMGVTIFTSREDALKALEGKEDEGK